MPGPSQFDRYLTDDGPAALVVREYLMPVEGDGGVLFPATYAAAEDKSKFPGGYNVDTDTRTGRTVALVDSVGAQANRIEVMFLPDKYDGRYAKLVPQVVVEAGEKSVNLLEAGHRAGDALVRCSSLAPDLQAAFKAVLKGDAGPLAKIAPTSLVFGVWDSRDTQAKLPRVVASTIRAFDVRQLHRSAQYNPPLDYAALDVFSEEEKSKAEGDTKSPLAKRGFVHVPATWSHGGVIADSGIRRDATLLLAALRQLRAGDDAAGTLALRRYVLGLALVAFTHAPGGYLRQGCLLVRDPKRAADNEFVEVRADGDRTACSITHDAALSYATEAAGAFGVGSDRKVPFEQARAVRDVTGDGETKPTGKGGAGKGGKGKKGSTGDTTENP